MNSLIKIATLIFINVLVTKIAAQNELDIRVTVQNLDTDNGMVFLALYDTEENFLSTSIKGEKSTIIDNKSTAVFKNVPVGTYAISIFHDENNNGKLDSNFMGIPKEDYGCSNDAKGFMGPPKWKDAKFHLNEENQSIIINL